MCVIFAVPNAGKFPTEEEILSGELTNDDGGGVCWAENGKVFWEKGIKGERVMQMIVDKILRPPALIHFRISTEGGVCQELTHPFPCNREASLDLTGESAEFPLLMHNGTCGRWKEEVKQAVQFGRGEIKVPEGKWSDTRALAFLVGLYGMPYLQFISGLEPDRVVVLNPDGRIQYCGKWYHQDGFYASNESYLFGRKGKGGVQSVQGFTRGEGATGRNLTMPSPSGNQNQSERTTPVLTIVKNSGAIEGGTKEKEPPLSNEEIEDIEDRMSLAWTKQELRELIKECKGKTLISNVHVFL